MPRRAASWDNWANLTEPEQRKFVASIDRQSRHLSLLVSDLLTLSTIDNGSVEPRPERIILVEAMQRRLDEYGESAADVTVTCPPEVCVFADPIHLGRILGNYIQNAFKYGSGEPRPRSQCDECGRTLISGHEASGETVDWCPNLDCPSKRSADTSALGMIALFASYVRRNCPRITQR